jgi:hypothetical protein
MSNKPTEKQLYTLAKLIKEVEPEMKIPENCNKHMASVRIAWLLKKKSNPKITKKQYL